MKAKDFVGGRGKKVGYQTEMFRIPTLLKPTVKQIGLQFRYLWDGISDPRGEKLISRIQLAIPDLEQVSDGSRSNQISSKAEVTKPDSRYPEDEEDTEEVEPDEPDQSDEQTIRDQAAKMQNYITNIRMLEREAVAASEELSELRSWVEDLRADRDGSQASAEQWASIAEQSQNLIDATRLELAEARSQLEVQTAKAEVSERLAEERLAEIERFSHLSQPAVNPEAIAMLQYAIKPPEQGGDFSRSNGSGVRKHVKQALKLLISGKD